MGVKYSRAIYGKKIVKMQRRVKNRNPLKLKR